MSYEKMAKLNLLILGVHGQMLYHHILSQRFFFFLFERSFFSEQFDIKFMKIGLLEVEIWLLKVCGSGDYAQY